jgi:hypothetical protein
MKGPIKNATGQVSFGTMAFAKMNKTIFYLHSDHIGRGYSTDFDYHDFSLWSDTPKIFSYSNSHFLHSI